jgi:hypothetical protein
MNRNEVEEPYVIEEIPQNPSRKRQIIFFVCLYIMLAIFIGKVAGKGFAMFFFAFFGILLFLMRVLPRLLGDRGRHCCCDHEPNVFMDATYKSNPANIYHEHSSGD